MACRGRWNPGSRRRVSCDTCTDSSGGPRPKVGCGRLSSLSALGEGPEAGEAGACVVVALVCRCSDAGLRLHHQCVLHCARQGPQGCGRHSLDDALLLLCGADRPPVFRRLALSHRSTIAEPGFPTLAVHVSQNWRSPPHFSFACKIPLNAGALSHSYVLRATCPPRYLTPPPHLLPRRVLWRALRRPHNNVGAATHAPCD